MIMFVDPFGYYKEVTAVAVYCDEAFAEFDPVC